MKVQFKYTYEQITNDIRITSASYFTVPHASLQEVDDLGNSSSEAAIE